MTEELQAEIEAFRRLIEALKHAIARLSRQADIVEQMAQERPSEGDEDDKGGD